MPFAITFAIFSMSLSISFGVTKNSLSLSFVIVERSTTVGTPIAITGMPKVDWLISFLLFPTPEPGFMPVLVS